MLFLYELEMKRTSKQTNKQKQSLKYSLKLGYKIFLASLITTTI